MKKLIFGLFLIIYFIGLVSACQYKVNESYEELELGLYDSNNNFIGPPLEFREFGGGGFNLYGCNPPSFKIYNTLKTDISLNVSYSTSWNKAIGGAVSQPHQTEISISKYSESDKIFGTCIDIGSGSISQESIKYLITEPELITLENELITKQREICKICPNGKQCLDDGALCSLDTECGSNVCNPDKRCGTFNGCSDGKKLCNQSNLCLTPSIKEVGEAYTCEWECKSNVGIEGICEESKGVVIKNWTYWVIGIIILISILVILILYTIKKGPLTRKIKELESKIYSLDKDFEDKEKQIRKLEDKGANLRKIIEENEKLLEIRNKKIESITKVINLKEERLKNISGDIKRKTEEEIVKLKNKITKEKELNNLLKNENNKTYKELKRKEELAVKKYGGSEKVYVNEFGYIQFKSNLSDKKKAGKIYHKWVYIEKLGIGSDKEIHHIDGDKLNNEMWNLIAVDKDIHRYKIKEARIRNEGWEFGLRYLLDNKFIKEESLHKYIRKKAEDEKIHL